MAAPTSSSRTTPSNAPMKDGFSTKITLSGDANIDFWEKEVKPPGVDGGDAVETTTMLNTAWRTMRPRQLKTLTEVSAKVAYSAVVYDQIIAQVNVEQTITITFPDDTTIAFFGYLKTFEPDDSTEGEQPEAEITIVPTNWDHVNSVEAGPAYGT